jgi:hypothetical protein
MQLVKFTMLLELFICVDCNLMGSMFKYGLNCNILNLNLDCLAPFDGIYD